MAEEAAGGGGSVSVSEKKDAPSLRGYDLDPKLDACLDLSIRRLVYSSVAGASAALLFFRSRTTRWASVAFGAGVGIGAAYTECSYILNGSSPKRPQRISPFPSLSQEEK
ncbi:MICOS complex subunit MIC10-like [Musa acuminata AAA Group]|uniref:MICOS complex subunit MIC10-like n=1 Tax=Musa acuminata AAA Group TaxID=214697 RepID=UPI0031D6E5D8